MKLLTTFALVSFGLAGSACSQAATSDQAEMPVAEIQTVSAEEPGGTFNLNIGGVEDETSGSGLNLNLGGEASEDGFIIGSEGFGGADFGETPVLDLELDPETPDAEDDGVIRLD